MTKDDKNWLSDVAALGCVVCRNLGYGVAIHAGQKKWEENYGTETELLEQTQQEVEELRLCRI